MMEARHQVGDFFVLRSPALPIDVLLSLFSTEGSDGAREEETRERLLRLTDAPHIREAIFIASPGLDRAIDAWRRHPGAESTKKVALAVLRYVSRMACRSTPFGLFSAISVGDLGERTEIRAAPLARCRPHARIDTHLLSALIDGLMGDPSTRGELELVVTPSLYECAGRLRYSRISLSDLATAFPLVDAEPSVPLRALLERAREPATRAQLVDVVCRSRPNVSEEAATSFVDTVAEHGLVVPAIAPAMTGTEPAAPLIAALRRSSVLADAAERLERAERALADVAAVPVGTARAAYERASTALEGIPSNGENASRIQIDLVRPLEQRTLGPSPAAELLRVAALVTQLFPPAKVEAIERFRMRFEARFEGREVPLLQALDDEFGVAFGETRSAADAHLLRDLPLGPEASRATEWTKQTARLADRVHAALLRGACEIEVGADLVSTDDLTARLPLPDSFCALATIHGTKSDVDAGRFVIEQPSFWTPVAKLLGRFCHASPELCERLRGVIAREERIARDHDVVLADVVHLTLGRHANVQLRPHLYAYEIVCHGRSSLPAERQIPAADLLVSVRNGKVILRSKRLGKRVLPSIAHAYNARIDAAEVYRFLDALQHQETGMASAWTWGVLGSHEYLPAVRSGSTILEAQRWRLSRARLRPIVEASGRAPRMSALARLRDELRIPRWVSVTSGDNFFALDLDNPLGAEAFAQSAANADSLVIREFTHARDPRALVEVDGGGLLLHEIVLPFVRGRASDAPSSTSRVQVGSSAPPPPAFERSLVPGSSVLFASIHGLKSGFDRLLASVLRPFARDAMQRGGATKWFFVRYADPSEHLRVRFFGDAALWTTLLPALYEALRPALAAESVWRIVIDTYEREVERYGGPEGTKLAEDVFFADSEACVDLLELLAESDEAPTDRWQLVVLGWDSLLRDFGFDLPARAELARKHAASYFREHGGTKALERALGQRARELGRTVLDILRPIPEERPLLQEARAIYARRSAMLRPTIAALRSAEERGGLTVPLATVVSSYLHMSADRLLDDALRAQELVMWELLSRGYRAAAAVT
jgi:thiopeptide-type bacteriocin biosynthesis protein